MKKSLPPFILLIIGLSACQPSQKNNSVEEFLPPDNVLASNTSYNQLTDLQKGEGWKLLFNGKNMEGWRTFKNQENNSWEVVDGALHCKPFDNADKRADIITVDQYSDFELVFDWKISHQCNSGVMFRVTEELEQPYFSGPEYQILDDKNYPGEVKPARFTGANYDVHTPPADKPVKAVGEWNTSRIVARGNHIEHWLNDRKLFEYEIGSADWTRLKEASKWKDVKGYCAYKSGHIDLQDHGNEVWFRNIMIKTL